MIDRYRQGVVPEPVGQPSDLPLSEVIQNVDAHMNALAFDLALREIWKLVGWANRHIDEQAPWTLAKDPAAARELDAVLYRAAEVLRILSHLLHPYMPAAMTRLAERLGERLEPPLPQAAKWGGLSAGTRVASGEPLFPRLDRAAVAS
jgi:methionyl-tRNA synthetase